MPPPSDPGSAKTSVTLDMVAEAAGVSPATVSRILTGNAKVSDQKREAVQQAIARLNYAPNMLAQSLARGRTLSIGVLTQSINSPFYGEALLGVEDALAGTGFVPLFVSGHWNMVDETDRMQHLLARRVDGVIMFTGRLTDAQLVDYAKTVPMVVTGRSLKARNLVSLRVDDYQGAYSATDYLIGLGHRHIAHIAGPRDHPDSVERVRGYRAALAAAGLPFERKLLTYAALHEASAVLALNQLLATQQPFTAIFCANDQTAVGAHLALHQNKLRVPQDVSLIGFDDLPVSRFLVPPLSTVHQPVYELGVEAARALLRLIAGERAQVQLPEPKLVIRDSTQRLRVRSPAASPKKGKPVTNL